MLKRGLENLALIISMILYITIMSVVVNNHAVFFGLGLAFTLLLVFIFSPYVGLFGFGSWVLLKGLGFVLNVHLPLANELIVLALSVVLLIVTFKHYEGDLVMEVDSNYNPIDDRWK